ncbi:MAG: hypothetical protein GY789_17375 [Hyphomicrobiales bacterium]|nr:hypothetical protein [Hyphomicrobiales bacterium]
MIVNVGRDWRIRSGPHQWICEKRLPGAKAARHQWKAMSFHPSPDSAVVWCGRRWVMELSGEYGFDALPPLCAALDAIVAEVRDAIEPLRSKESPEAAATAIRANAPANLVQGPEHHEDTPSDPMAQSSPRKAD